MLDHTVELVEAERAVEALAAELVSAPSLALDIETINWWDRAAERVALVQLAFRRGDRTHVAVIDALSGLDLEPLRPALELSGATKAIHNASFDAARLARHYRIAPSPIHDTMLAARRGGERRCSLQAQVEAHLGLALDKSEQRGDWSRRPLRPGQLRYAALDAACTLLLYERQVARGLRGDYTLRDQSSSFGQSSLPLDAPLISAPSPIHDEARPVATERDHEMELDLEAAALLGIVAELAGRYSPEALAVSVGRDRVGLAGWIIDGALGAEADFDEGAARDAIARLISGGLIALSPTLRLTATERGALLWSAHRQRLVNSPRPSGERTE
jgi:hypothetical protein